MLAGTHCEAYFHRFHALIRVRSSAFTRAQLHRVPGTRASEGAPESGWSAQVEAKRSRRLFISGSTYRSSNGCDRALQVGSVTSGANGRTLGSPYDCPPFAVVAAADDVAIGTSSKVVLDSARNTFSLAGGQDSLSPAGRGVLDGVHQSPNRRGRPRSYTAQASGSAARWIELKEGARTFF